MGEVERWDLMEWMGETPSSMSERSEKLHVSEKGKGRPQGRRVKTVRTSNQPGWGNVNAGVQVRQKQKGRQGGMVTGPCLLSNDKGREESGNV